MHIHPIIVLPARDEAAILDAACASLGFDRAGTIPGRNLVVVDNGSRDATGELARAITERSPPGTVEVVHEPEAGHVPARHAGAMAAMRRAANAGIDPRDLLVLQADADTIYRPGYIESMVRAAERAGLGHLLEGRSVPPDADDDACGAFRTLEAAIDSTVAGLVDPDDPHDVVVDDKVAAYRLADYLAWGGHAREYDSDGDEVLVETTRLHMRAMRLGGRRVRVEGAEAVTSSRASWKLPRSPSRPPATPVFDDGRNSGWTPIGGRPTSPLLSSRSARRSGR